MSSLISGRRLVLAASACRAGAPAMLVVANTPAQACEFVNSEIQRGSFVIQQSGVKPA